MQSAHKSVVKSRTSHDRTLFVEGADTYSNRENWFRGWTRTRARIPSVITLRSVWFENHHRSTKDKCLLGTRGPGGSSHHNHRQSFIVRDRDSAIHILTDRSEHFPDTLLHPQNARTIVVVVFVVERRVSIKIRARLFPTNTNSQFDGIRDSICEIHRRKVNQEERRFPAISAGPKTNWIPMTSGDDSTTTQGWKGWKASACKSNDREARAARRDVGKRLTSESRSAPPDARACPLP